MGSVGTYDRQTSRMVIALALVAAMIVSSFLPALAWAAQVTERSIQLSSSAVDATDVSYKVKFKPVAAAAGFVIDFCSNSPLVGQACTPPSDFNITSASTGTSGWSVSAEDEDDNTTTLTGAMSAGVAVTVDIDHITNPSATGPLYARIVTYASGSVGNFSNSTTLGSGVVDDGAVALSITDAVNVSAAVQEALTFCVSGAAPAAACASGVTAPTVKLGNTVGSLTVLEPGQVHTGSIYTQISTNAANGAIVRLKSDAIECGGLHRVGADPDVCDITPSSTSVVANDSKFGVKTFAATGVSGGSTPAGAFQPAAGSVYDTTNYRMHWVSGDGTGVTSTYGDPFLDTDGAPVNNMQMQLEFAAAANNSTPAGLYRANLSLIATGTY